MDTNRDNENGKDMAPYESLCCWAFHIIAERDEVDGRRVEDELHAEKNADGVLSCDNRDEPQAEQD